MTLASSTPADRLQTLFNAQQTIHLEVARRGVSWRREKLRTLLKVVLKSRKEICQALHADFGKPPFEVDAVEVLPTTGAIRHALQHIGKWCAPQRVPTPLMFAGSTSWVQYEPKGVCLIISPWNFPVNLSLVPLVSAIAAGNTVMLKPSEFTPHTSELLASLLSEVFEANEVAVVQGDAEVAKALLEMPFHHVFFTGSPAVGKLVMQAAAKHLSSVTLELGGKSPTIIDETANIRKAARRIALAKWANAGQICTTCDYLLVHRSRRDELLQELKSTFEAFGEGDPRHSPHYTRIVNERHFHRVCQLLDDAIQRGAKVIAGGQCDESNRFIAPTILTEVPMDAGVMQEEIFGPLLPVLTFDSIEQAVDIINGKERPLTMNIFSRNRRHIDYILANTRAGGTTINNATMHFYNHDLPFGGVNHSGIGKSHGWYGFVEFSNARAIYRQDLPGAPDLLRPPYKAWKRWLIDFAIKYL